ncbi:MAG: MFS transporter [Clostridiaceae bacterium]|nr:MFS transporter [Clostridiaceae bacterium]
MKTKRNKILIGLAVFCTALLSRAPISSIGQLIPFIKSDLALSAAAAGSVTTLISIMYALMSPVGGYLTAKVKAKKLIYFCLSLTFAGTLARTFLGSFGLFTGTVLIGAALGILNVQMPIFIRNQFPGRVGLYMGMYTATLTLSTGIAFASVIPLMDLSGSWQNSLRILSLLAVPALLVWLLVPRSSLYTSESKVKLDISWSKMRAHFPLGILYGLQGLIYFSTTTWMPSILMSQGRSGEESAFLMVLLQIISLPTNFSCGSIMQRSSRKWLMALLASGLFISGLFLVISAPEALALHLFAIILMGLGNGLMFAMPFALLGFSGKDSEENMNISTFVPLVGYTLAAIGPIALGYLYDLTQSWTAPIIFMMVGSLAYFIFGKKAGDLVDAGQEND